MANETIWDLGDSSVVLDTDAYPTGHSVGADKKTTSLQLVSYMDSKIQLPSTSKVTGLDTALSTKALDSAVVHNTGNETIAGIKTFSSTVSGSINGNSSTVTTNANLTGVVTSIGNATSINNNTINLVYISTSGVDAVGRGNQLLPYATLSYAKSQITNATPSNPYVLFITGNIADTGQIYFSPNISFFAASPVTITNSMNVIADPTWQTAASGSSATWSNLNFTKSVILDFMAITPSSGIITGNFSNVNFEDIHGGIKVNGWAAGDNAATFMKFDHCSGLFVGDSFFYRGNNNSWSQSQIASAEVQISGTQAISRDDYWHQGLVFNNRIDGGVPSTRVTNIEMYNSTVDNSAFDISQLEENSVTANISGGNFVSIIISTGGAGSFIGNVYGTNQLLFLRLLGSVTSTLNIDPNVIPTTPFSFDNDGLFTVNIANPGYKKTVPTPYLASGTIVAADIVNETIVIPAGTAALTLDWGAAADIVSAFPIPLPDAYVELMIINNSLFPLTLTNTTDPTHVGTIGLVGGNTKTQATLTARLYRVVVGNIITPSVGIFGG